MRDALAAEPALADSLREPAAPLLLAPFLSPPLSPEQAEGMDLILEGFLLHHGRPRQLELAERGRQVLAGDYCYAHGLVRVADAGDLVVIEALSDLISLGAGLAARGRTDALAPLWRATAAAIAASAGPRSEADLEAFLAAKAALREADDVGPLAAIAGALPPTPGLEAALAP
jgi:hypothetical protein